MISNISICFILYFHINSTGSQSVEPLLWRWPGFQDINVSNELSTKVAIISIVLLPGNGCNPILRWSGSCATPSQASVPESLATGVVHYTNQAKVRVVSNEWFCLVYIWTTKKTLHILTSFPDIMMDTPVLGSLPCIGDIQYKKTSHAIKSAKNMFS